MGDERVKMELFDGFDPLPVSSTDEKSFGFQIIKKTVLDLFPSVTVAPGRIQICLNIELFQNVHLQKVWPPFGLIFSKSCISREY